MRVHEPLPGVLAFYEGRDAAAPLPGWQGEAQALGIAAYAVVSGNAALVYDTHLSHAHGRTMRDALAARGVRRLTVLLSHWHADHVAGNAAFADGPILANPLTRDILLAERAALTAGVPAIDPLVLPTATVGDGEILRIGARSVEVRHVDAHSIDGCTLWLPDANVLLAGDTLEDPVTYVAEPDRLEAHLAGLDRLAALAPPRILPNHGLEARIATGGYGPGLIDATRTYVERLLAARADPALAAAPLETFVAEALARGDVTAFAPYEAVHAANVARVTGRPADA
jgi:glyoxylase-like metal-dependent hydrolase (beta-lactamase superfamily II)